MKVYVCVKCRWKMIVQVSVVLKRIVVHSNLHFNKSCNSHLQSQIDQLLRSYI